MHTASDTPDATVRIGALAEQTGCSVPTIRYYEQVGLIPPAKRRSSGHRVYDPAAARLLIFIRRSRDFGFSIEQIRELISLTQPPVRDCVEARDIAKANLASVRGKILELMTLERNLAGFVDACNASCAGGPAPECNILRDLRSPDATAATPSACCK